MTVAAGRGNRAAGRGRGNPAAGGGGAGAEVQPPHLPAAGRWGMRPGAPGPCWAAPRNALAALGQEQSQFKAKLRPSLTSGSPPRASVPRDLI